MMRHTDLVQFMRTRDWSDARAIKIFVIYYKDGLCEVALTFDTAKKHFIYNTFKFQASCALTANEMRAQYVFDKYHENVWTEIRWFDEYSDVVLLSPNVKQNDNVKIEDMKIKMKYKKADLDYISKDIVDVDIIKVCTATSIEALIHDVLGV